MAFNPILRRRLIATATATTFAASIALTPRRKLYAESPSDDITPIRKPIYDSPTPSTFTPPTPSPSSSSTLIPSTAETSTPPSSRRTPTDRLASEIKRTRLFLHSHAVSLEDTLNSTLTSLFSLEHSFTSTLSSLAPPPTSNEQLLPGLLYVLVSSMFGSILTRRSNILFRFSVPIAAGLAAGRVFVPITMGNVGALVWEYEKKVPVVAETHQRVQERVERFLVTGREHSKMGVEMVKGKVGEGVGVVEEWVRKGK
ncbi:MAG: hypothetical protein M1820_002616 [Bogoriella megaspora]|nr:MAG: hypothetical protein M1820_002616 [Bogoriella megaspora]